MLKNEIIVLVICVAAVAFIYFGEIVLISLFAYNKLRGRYRRILLTKKAILLHFFAITGIICFCYGYFIEPYRIEVTFVPIETNKLINTSFRIVQISDLHCDKKTVNEKAIVKIINDLKPDIIVFTGDAVNKPSALPLFKETMQNLDASLGKFAVYGNWETWHWPDLDYYSGTDFKLLDAQTVRLEKNSETISISGINCGKSKFADRTLNKLSNEHFNILLYHFPGFAKYIDSYNVDLYLCGHTHGGQIALPFYGALITMSEDGKKYESGRYTVGRTILYVNRGLGMDAYPPRIRFFARPEIAVFDIGPK